MPSTWRGLKRYSDPLKKTCGYMTVEEVVHGFYKDGEMEVRCFFLCGFPHKLMSYSICSVPIDMARREEIENNLLKINEDIHTLIWTTNGFATTTIYRQYQTHKQKQRNQKIAAWNNSAVGHTRLSSIMPKHCTHERSFEKVEFTFFVVYFDMPITQNSRY